MDAEASIRITTSTCPPGDRFRHSPLKTGRAIAMATNDTIAIRIASRIHCFKRVLWRWRCSVSARNIIAPQSTLL